MTVLVVFAADARAQGSCLADLPSWAAVDAGTPSEWHCGRYFASALSSDDGYRLAYTTAWQCLSSVAAKGGFDVPVPDWETGNRAKSEEFDPVSLVDLVMLLVDAPGEAKQLAVACLEPLATQAGSLSGASPSQRALFKEAVDLVFATGSPAEWIRLADNFLRPSEAEYKPTAFEQIFVNRDIVRNARYQSTVEWLRHLVRFCDDGAGRYKQGDRKGVSAAEVARERAFLQSLLKSALQDAVVAQTTAEEYALCLERYGSQVRTPTDPRAEAYSRILGHRDWASMARSEANANRQRTREDTCFLADQIRSLDPLFRNAEAVAADFREKNAQYQRYLERLLANLRQCREDSPETKDLLENLYRLTDDRCVHHEAAEIERLLREHARPDDDERIRLRDAAVAALKTCSADAEREIVELERHLQATQRSCDGARDAQQLADLRQRLESEIVSSERTLEKIKLELSQLESRIFDADCGLEEAETEIGELHRQVNDLPRSCQSRIGNAYVRWLAFTRSRMDDFRLKLNGELQRIELELLEPEAAELSHRIDALDTSNGATACASILELEEAISAFESPSHVQFTFGRNADEKRRARVSIAACPEARALRDAFGRKREALRSQLDASNLPFTEPRALARAEAAWEVCGLEAMQRELDAAATALQARPACGQEAQQRMDARLQRLREQQRELGSQLAEYESALAGARERAEAAFLVCDFAAIEQPRPKRLCLQEQLSSGGQSHLRRIDELLRDVVEVESARAGLERAIADMPTLLDLCRVEGAALTGEFWRGAEHADILRRFEPTCIRESPSLAFYDSLRAETEGRRDELAGKRQRLRQLLDRDRRLRERAAGWRGEMTAAQAETLREGLREAEELRRTIFAEAEPPECYPDLLQELERSVPMTPPVAEDGREGPESFEEPPPEPEVGADEGQGWGRGKVQRTATTPEDEPRAADDPCAGLDIDRAVKSADLAVQEGDVEAWKRAILPVLHRGCRDPRVMQRVQTAGSLESSPDREVASAVAEGRPGLGQPSGRSGSGIADFAQGLATALIAQRSTNRSSRRQPPSSLDPVTRTVYEGIFAEGADAGGGPGERGPTAGGTGGNAGTTGEPTCGIVNYSYASSADPGSPLAYLVHAKTTGAQHGYGVFTVPTLITNDGTVLCRGARSCLEKVNTGFRDYADGTTLTEYPTARAAHDAVNRACPDPIYRADY